MTSPDTAASLRGAGLRVTRQRLAVMDALAAQPHAGADQVRGRVASSMGQVSTQAVYDVLHVLAERGLVRRIQPAGSVARYELRVGDNHHHLVCRRCGAVHDVDCATGETPCLDPADGSGFVVHEAEVTYWGLCPGCSARSSSHDPNDPNASSEPDEEEEDHV